MYLWKLILSIFRKDKRPHLNSLAVLNGDSPTPCGKICMQKQYIVFLFWLITTQQMHTWRPFFSLTYQPAILTWVGITQTAIMGYLWWRFAFANIITRSQSKCFSNQFCYRIKMFCCVWLFSSRLFQAIIDSPPGHWWWKICIYVSILLWNIKIFDHFLLWSK